MGCNLYLLLLDRAGVKIHGFGWIRGLQGKLKKALCWHLENQETIRKGWIGKIEWGKLN